MKNLLNRLAYTYKSKASLIQRVVLVKRVIKEHQPTCEILIFGYVDKLGVYVCGDSKDTEHWADFMEAHKDIIVDIMDIDDLASSSKVMQNRLRAEENKIAALRHMCQLKLDGVPWDDIPKQLKQTYGVTWTQPRAKLLECLDDILKIMNCNHWEELPPLIRLTDKQYEACEIGETHHEPN